MDSKRNLIFAISAFVATVIYLLLRIVYPETIEFGYDQPRLSNVTMDFIQNGSFITLQYYSLPTAWENLSWGPALILFNSIFFYVSNDPIVLSYLMVFFNLLSILIILYLGFEFFNPKVGIISAVLLATQPWWVIFSRMIYQPTPIVTFISISLLFLFKALNKPKSIWTALLFVSWGVLLQMYLITISFIFLSGLIFLINNKFRISVKYLVIGFFANLLLYFPSIKYYIDNPELFYKFIGFKGRYNTPFLEVLDGFTKGVSGFNFKWQLGYAYDQFVTGFNYYNLFFYIVLALFLFLISYGVYNFIKAKDWKMLYILMFMVAPLWAIPVIGVEYVVPRYFLYILPTFCLFVAYSVDSLMNKISRLFIMVPIFISAFWIIFVFSYFTFIKKYDYPKGVLSPWSDSPFYHIDKAFKWIQADSKKYSAEYTVSSDLSFPYENRFNDAQTYYWRHILKKDLSAEFNKEVTHYLMYNGPFVDERIVEKMQFGPYIVGRVLKGDPSELVDPDNTPEVNNN